MRYQQTHGRAAASVSGSSGLHTALRAMPYPFSGFVQGYRPAFSNTLFVFPHGHTLPFLAAGTNKHTAAHCRRQKKEPGVRTASMVYAIQSGYSQSEKSDFPGINHCGPQNHNAIQCAHARWKKASASTGIPAICGHITELANPPGWRHRINPAKQKATGASSEPGLHPYRGAVAIIRPAGCRGGRPPPRYTRNPAAAGCTMLCIGTHYKPQNGCPGGAGYDYGFKCYVLSSFTAPIRHQGININIFPALPAAGTVPGPPAAG